MDLWVHTGFIQTFEQMIKTTYENTSYHFFLYCIEGEQGLITLFQSATRRQRRALASPLGCWSLFQHWANSRNTPRTGHQCITGCTIHKFDCMIAGDLSTFRKPTQTPGEHANSTNSLLIRGNSVNHCQQSKSLKFISQHIQIQAHGRKADI